MSRNCFGWSQAVFQPFGGEDICMTQKATIPQVQLCLESPPSKLNSGFSLSKCYCKDIIWGMRYVCFKKCMSPHIADKEWIKYIWYQMVLSLDPWSSTNWNVIGPLAHYLQISTLPQLHGRPWASVWGSVFGISRWIDQWRRCSIAGLSQEETSRETGRIRKWMESGGRATHISNMLFKTQSLYVNILRSPLGRPSAFSP